MVLNLKHLISIIEPNRLWACTSYLSLSSNNFIQRPADMIHSVLTLWRSFYSIILGKFILFTSLNILISRLVIIYHHLKLKLILIICHVNIMLIDCLLISLDYLIHALLFWIFNLIIIVLIKLNLLLDLIMTFLILKHLLN